MRRRLEIGPGTACPAGHHGLVRVSASRPAGGPLAVYGAGGGTPNDGAGDRNRTGDPVITSDVLYQLSYTSLEFVRREALPWGESSRK